MFPATLKTPDGLTLVTRSWLIPQPKALILLAHGLGEHCGRYAANAAAFNAAGYSIVTLDHRGHGRSEGQPRAYAQSMAQLADDFETLWQATGEAFPGMPRFVLGHSMGGQVALHFVLRHQAELRGVVTSGAGLLLGDDVPGWLIALGKAIFPRLPWLPVAPVELQALSHDPRIIEANAADPLSYQGRLKGGVIVALIRGGEDILARAPQFKLPMLILHGGEDRIISPRASQLFYAGAGSADKQLKIYPRLYHEILNEPEQGEIIAEICAWMAARL
jgi:alpha-beta hydrolase superfamily lysophospholipase